MFTDAETGMFVQPLAHTPEESVAFTRSPKRRTKPRSNAIDNAATCERACAAFDHMCARRSLQPPRPTK